MSRTSPHYRRSRACSSYLFLEQLELLGSQPFDDIAQAGPLSAELCALRLQQLHFLAELVHHVLLLGFEALFEVDLRVGEAETGVSLASGGRGYASRVRLDSTRLDSITFSSCTAVSLFCSVFVRNSSSSSMCSTSFLCSSLSDSRCLRSLFVRASSSSSTSRLSDSIDLRADCTHTRAQEMQVKLTRACDGYDPDRARPPARSIVLTCSSFSSCCRTRRSRASSASVSWHFFSQSTFIATC